MNQAELVQWLQELIASNNLHEFYTCSEWLKVRADVLNELKHECIHCKAKGFYSKATHVHHVQFLKKHPELALSKFYTYNGKQYRNLIPVCKDCHETVCHPERLGHSKKEPLTPERW